MDLFHSLSGMLEAEFVSADIGAALETMTDAGIPLYGVALENDVTVRLQIPRRNLRQIKMLATRRGDELKLVSRKGLYWQLKAAVQRPVLLVGFFLLLLLGAYLPTRVLFVRVEGNSTVPQKWILEAAENCGIRFGASRREVRSEKMKNALLREVPQLQWAGVNTNGCVAVISVRERMLPIQEKSRSAVCSVVALRDGVVTSCTASSGNLLCRPGQAVKRGEVLISGYTDCGIAIQACRAEGEVYAQTTREISLISPKEYCKVSVKSKIMQGISLLVGKKRINLWKDSGIWDITCGRIYEEYYVTLPGDFRLPLALVLEEYAVYETELAAAENPELAQRVSTYASDYIRGQMNAGDILSQDLRYGEMDGCIVLTGKYICTEMIGTVQWEQIGEKNGKSD